MGRRAEFAAGHSPYAVERQPGMDEDLEEFHAVRKGQVLGRLEMVTPYEEERGYVTHLDVPPEHRRMGVASTLMDHARKAHGDDIGYTLGDEKPEGYDFIKGYHKKTGWLPPALRNQ